MHDGRHLALLLILAALPAGACAASPVHADVPLPNGPSVTNKGNPVSASGPVWVAEQFPTLDAYLAHLKRESFVGGKWYRELKPGLYELVAGNLHLDHPAEEKSIFTREELERRFGFRR